MLETLQRFAFLALCTPLMAQPAFDVASVKPNQSADPPNTNVPLGPGEAFKPTGGYFSATNYPLLSYIGFAYKVMGNEGQALQAQLPEWVRTERYDIQARVEGNPTKDEMRGMMRALLADRFKLAMHREDRQGPVGALVLVKPGKLGPQLRVHPADATCALDIAPPSGDERADLFPALCGGLLQMRASGPGRQRYAARNVTIEFLANGFIAQANLGRPVVNRTGLEGRYDFSLEFAPETRTANQPGVEAPAEPSGPTFEEAMREQLGLRLEPQQGTVAVLIVDHVERPSGN